MHYTIAILGGDGIGPEVVREALKVLAAVGNRFGHTFTTNEGLIGGAAIDATGTALPDATVELCKSSDAVLLGAVGGPKWDNPNAKVRPEQGLLGIRKALGLFANLRPVSVHALLADASPLRAERIAGVDMLVVRELTGGIYFGEKRREHDAHGEWASDLCIYTEAEIERIVRMAAQLARGRKGRLLSVDKANVLETSRLWRSTTMRVISQEFPDIHLEHMLVDACAMHLLRRPADFDVIVTENMFGDILTDEASMLTGSMGMLPSASLGEDRGRETKDRGQTATSTSLSTSHSSVAADTRIGLYEPIHGSAPDIAGQGKANPLATILSLALLMRHSLGLESEAQAVEAAVYQAVEAGYVTGDIARPGQTPHSTTEVGDKVTELVTGA